MAHIGGVFALRTTASSLGSGMMPQSQKSNNPLRTHTVPRWTGLLCMCVERGGIICRRDAGLGQRGQGHVHVRRSIHLQRPVGAGPQQIRVPGHKLLGGPKETGSTRSSA